MGQSKVLIVGATGHLGQHVANASVKLGHPTFLLVRTTTPSDPAKAAALKAYQEAGVTLLTGDVTDHDSLVAALKKVDVVISCLSGGQVLDQPKILDAAKETGTIKRFVPSEFGVDVDRVDFDIPLTKPIFAEKQQVRRAIEKSGIPYTYIISGGFASWYLAPIVQDLYAPPPRDSKLLVLGDGNTKAIFVDEADMGTFTVKCIDDPRAENKLLNIIPSGNVASTNEVIALWEKQIGHIFEKEFLDKAEVLKSIDDLSFPNNLMRAIKYAIFVKGDMTRFPLDPSKDVEATKLYPDVKYTTIDEYLTRLV